MIHMPAEALRTAWRGPSHRSLPEHAREVYDAVVVGAGPNGLSAAVVLAREGLAVLVVEAAREVGGACRSGGLTRPGFVHDVGASILPLAAASPLFERLPLERHGLRWVHPAIPVAHPLGGGRAVAAYRSLGTTARRLGRDRSAYEALLEPLVEGWPVILGEVMRPLVRFPRHPVAMARFGTRALLPASTLARWTFSTEEARALFGGIAAHATVPLSSPGSSALGLMLLMAAHGRGWPFPRGGSSALTDALAGYLRELGGEIVTGWRVRSLEELPPARAVVLGLTPRQILALAGPHLPRIYRARLSRYRYGGAAFKVDYALREPIPWTAEACRRAGTVHVTGPLAELEAAEAAVARGRVPERPFILLAQHSLFDPSRAPGDRHTAWLYCHVPHGSTVDMTGRIERQIERYAPGFREIVLERRIRSPFALEAANPNLVGGDINGGANTLPQLVARPVLSRRPHRLPFHGLYQCSSATPPGGGVHGMCGFHAARAVLEDLR
jgi:phytoene dehydrogenase-like protein